MPVGELQEDLHLGKGLPLMAYRTDAPDTSLCCHNPQDVERPSSVIRRNDVDISYLEPVEAGLRIGSQLRD